MIVVNQDHAREEHYYCNETKVKGQQLVAGSNQSNQSIGTVVVCYDDRKHFQRSGDASIVNVPVTAS